MAVSGHYLFHNKICLGMVLCIFNLHVASLRTNNQYPKITVLRFLLTVNDTWDPNGCIHTVATGWLEPNLPMNKSKNIIVGNCDYGALDVMLNSPGEGNNKYSAHLTFHSHVIEDASPPTCTLSWNGTYLLPKTPGVYEGPANNDPLPSCFTADSREGYHMTYYWFHILDWKFENNLPT